MRRAMKSKDEEIKKLKAQLKEKCDELQKKVNEEVTVKRIQAMSLEDLNKTKTKYLSRVKLIENTEKSLLSVMYNCVICKERRKNISFSDACNHVAVCEECE